VDAIFEAYLAAQRRRRASALTLKAVRHALRQTQRWLDAEGIAAAELSLLQCEEYFDRLLGEQAVSTVRRHLAYVRAAYRYGLRHELVERDPTADVRLPWLPDIEPATYSSDELKAIHAAIRCEREEVCFFLFAFAGLRLGEVAGLRWARVDFDRWQLRLIGKGGKFRLVPLHPAVNEVLREQQQRSRDEYVLSTIKGQRLAARTLGRAARELVNRAGVEIEQPSHAFRRTVATVMYEQGVRTRVIERIMGWAPRRSMNATTSASPTSRCTKLSSASTTTTRSATGKRERSASQPFRRRRQPSRPSGWPTRWPGSSGSNNSSARSADGPPAI